MAFVDRLPVLVIGMVLGATAVLFAWAAVDDDEVPRAGRDADAADAAGAPLGDHPWAASTASNGATSTSMSASGSASSGSTTTWSGHTTTHHPVSSTTPPSRTSTQAPPPGAPVLEALPFGIDGGFCCSGAIWHNGSAYLLGGFAGEPDGIARFDGDGLTMLDERLPWDGWTSAATSDGRYGFVVGGFDAAGRVARFDPEAVGDPASDPVSVFATGVPAGRYPAAAVVGDGLYVFTGWDVLPTIHRVDLDTGKVRAMESSWPTEAGGASAVAVGDHVLLFGGPFEGAWLYDPTADALIPLEMPLPPLRHAATAVVDGQVYVYGGVEGYYDMKSEIWRVDPYADTAVRLDTYLPSPRPHALAVTDGTWVYVLGGSGDMEDVLVHRP